MRKTFLLILASLILIPTLSHAALLGSAAEYNAFILDNMYVWNSDSQGSVAVGGDLTMSNYGVGSSARPAEFDIVSGGNISFQSGSVRGGGVFADGNINIKSYGINGDVVANGSITRSSGSAHSYQENAGVSSPIDFLASHNYLHSVSAALASTQANGITTVSQWGAINLTGTSNINYFDLDGNDLNNATSLTFNIGANDVAIVNISGQYSDFGGFAINGAGGKEKNIIYNFYDATGLSVHNISVKGSLLAPEADIDFNSGHINGTMIANSVTGNGEFHWYPFEHDVVVPEPATMLLLGGGLIGMFSLGKKKE